MVGYLLPEEEFDRERILSSRSLDGIQKNESQGKSQLVDRFGIRWAAKIHCRTFLPPS
jgi:hypothetical protein